LKTSPYKYNNAARYALDGINLHIGQGEFVLLSGPSGCGKSTLARTLNGLIPHSIAGQMEGRVVVNGLDTREHPVAQLASRVGMVFQIPETQLFNLTVGEEVAFGPRNLGLNEEEVKERVAFALEAVGLAGYRARAAYQLSGGEKQRLVIASVLAMQPRVLVLDEPFSSLDEKGIVLVLETLKKLNRELGLTVLIIEHRVAPVARFARRFIVVNEGKVILDGEPAAVLTKGEQLTALGIRRRVISHTIRNTQCATCNTQPAIIFDSVSFSYDGRRVLHDLSFQIGQGEFAALVGENGAGKTTVARLILGLLQPQAGEVRVAAGDGRPRWGQDVGLLLQNPLEQLFCDTVEEEVAFGPRNFGHSAEPVVDEVLAITGLIPYRRRPVSALSCGQQQRLALAAVLALSPTIVILDEPTVGQDWGHLQRFMDFVARLHQQGTTVLLITHDAEIVRIYAQRTLHLQDGRVVR